MLGLGIFGTILVILFAIFLRDILRINKDD